MLIGLKFQITGIRSSNSDSWNPSSRTPYTSASTSDAWNPSAQTPFGDRNGGRTPNDAGAGGRRAVATYGAKSALVGGSRYSGGSAPVVNRGGATPMQATAYDGSVS